MCNKKYGRNISNGDWIAIALNEEVNEFLPMDPLSPVKPDYTIILPANFQPVPKDNPCSSLSGVSYQKSRKQGTTPFKLLKNQGVINRPVKGFIRKTIVCFDSSILKKKTINLVTFHELITDSDWKKAHVNILRIDTSYNITHYKQPSYEQLEVLAQSLSSYLANQKKNMVHIISNLEESLECLSHG